MEESGYKFRSALGGFHKGDVTAYIEKTTLEHRSELLERERRITELQNENHALQQQLNLLMMFTPAQSAAPTPAEPKSEPKPTPEPAPAAAPARRSDMAALELQAYRRAEAVERAANQRAKKLYQQLEALCADTMEDFQDTDAAVKQAIEAMTRQANSLAQAYEALSAATATYREKLAATNELLPDDE